MKITKSQLKQIILEELENVFYEQNIKPANISKDLPPAKMPKVKPKGPPPAKMPKLQPKGPPAAKMPTKEEVSTTLSEDGHEDTSSARRAMQTIIEDAGEMLRALDQMDSHLPTWWTNKMAVAANNLNKMRDYLLVSSMNDRG